MSEQNHWLVFFSVFLICPKKGILVYNKDLLKIAMQRGRQDGSVVEIPCYSCREPKSSSQQPMVASKYL